MKDLKKLYIDFFVSKDHAWIPSAPIIPENDPTCLFNTAGMQPLVPYLSGQPHPLGTRLTDFQKCFRLTDLEEIGDATHHTFFEMLGNWSLGDYFKKESITWSYEFLTKVLGFPSNRLAVTVFAGDELVPRDSESAELWKSLGISEKHIAYLDKTGNWWSLGGGVGPCGPDTEIFYFRSEEEIPEVFDPEDDRWVEIWNNVFTQYNGNEDGSVTPLASKNVDTGMGVERVTAVLEGVNDNYMTSLFRDKISYLEEVSGHSYQDLNYQRAMRIIADHMRAITIISGDNAKIVPSNTDQGYILRRLIRRVIRYAKKIDIDINTDFDIHLAKLYIEQFKNYYPELEKNQEHIIQVLETEKKKFARTLEKGLREFEKIAAKVQDKIDGETAFHLYDTYGFPIELTEELALEMNLTVDKDGFEAKFKEHQEKSRAGAKERFKGGLQSDSEMNIKYHTATHLLNAALKKVIGPEVHQMGSNITDERMRFDFPCDHKLTEEEKKQTEELVNQWIQEAIPVTHYEVSKEEAVQMGAEAQFIERYGDKVMVYQIGDASLEICGGPHVSNTSELGQFKIKKEESSSAGVRRIKAVLEKEN
ncbi:MAG: alanine--tRNA ligase [Firmicutes bacterium]|nr:alanine--tRNA ligase [Bacillota bacterium]